MGEDKNSSGNYWCAPLLLLSFTNVPATLSGPVAPFLRQVKSIAHCSLCTVHCELCTVHCASCIVHCAVSLRDARLPHIAD